jgi:hypothetical protein
LQAFCREIKEPSLLDANLYLNATIPSDLAIILSWQLGQSIDQKNDVGFCLANVHKKFGLVDHVFWRMIENQ